MYQWSSITADGQVFRQNANTQEYEKVDQLRLILETNPKTNEVEFFTERCTCTSSYVLSSKSFIAKIKSSSSSVRMEVKWSVSPMEHGKRLNQLSSAIISISSSSITRYEAVDHRSHSPGDQETGNDEMTNPHLLSYILSLGERNSMLAFRKIPHVKVEALGYATVAFNSQSTDCRTAFNDGSSIDVFANGTYSIFESDGEKFEINDNGDVLFDFQQ